MNEEVGPDMINIFKNIDFCPTLFFFDPWGYKGLSLGLIESVMKNWGCDGIFFFNYNRVNAGLDNPRVTEHINAIFGDEKATKLREECLGVSKDDREAIIVNELALVIQNMGIDYVLPFCFKDKSGKRTSHHLIFLSKHVKGYEIMKGIMAQYSISDEQGVPSFTFMTARPQQLFLFEFNRKIDELADMLLKTFAGRTMKMKDVYNQHHVGKPFIEKNYKSILTMLETEKRITIHPPAEKRQRRNGQRTLSNEAYILFPPKGS